MRIGPDFVVAISQRKRVCRWKVCIKISWFVLTWARALSCHLRSVMRNEDMLRFRLYCKNFTWIFFRTCGTKIVIKSQHQRKIRSGLRHLIPKTCKMISKRTNHHRPMVLAHCARIYPGLRVSWYVMYFPAFKLYISTLFRCRTLDIQKILICGIRSHCVVTLSINSIDNFVKK